MTDYPLFWRPQVPSAVDYDPVVDLDPREGDKYWVVDDMIWEWHILLPLPGRQLMRAVVWSSEPLDRMKTKKHSACGLPSAYGAEVAQGHREQLTTFCGSSGASDQIDRLLRTVVETFTPGTAISGTFTATDTYLRSYSLSVAGHTSANTPAPSGGTVSTTGATWQLDTTGMAECGYVIAVRASDRAIRNSQSNGWYRTASVGFCIREDN